MQQAELPRLGVRGVLLSFAAAVRYVGSDGGSNAPGKSVQRAAAAEGRRWCWCRQRMSQGCVGGPARARESARARGATAKPQRWQIGRCRRMQHLKARGKARVCSLLLRHESGARPVPDQHLVQGSRRRRRVGKWLAGFFARNAGAHSS